MVWTIHQYKRTHARTTNEMHTRNGLDQNEGEMKESQQNDICKFYIYVKVFVTEAIVTERNVLTHRNDCVPLKYASHRFLAKLFFSFLLPISLFSSFLLFSIHTSLSLFLACCVHLLSPLCSHLFWCTKTVTILANIRQAPLIYDANSQALRICLAIKVYVHDILKCHRWSRMTKNFNLPKLWSSKHIEKKDNEYLQGNRIFCQFGSFSLCVSILLRFLMPKLCMMCQIF